MEGEFIRPGIFELEEIAPWLSEAIGRNFEASQLFKEHEGGVKRHRALMHGGLAVAYASWEVVGTEGALLDIAVAPLFRRQGFGEALMRVVLNLCVIEEMKLMILEVREDNLGAVEFYKKLGFREIGRRKGYYQREELDALVMEWRG